MIKGGTWHPRLASICAHECTHPPCSHTQMLYRLTCTSLQGRVSLTSLCTVLGIEPRVSCVLDECSSLEPQPQNQQTFACVASPEACPIKLLQHSRPPGLHRWVMEVTCFEDMNLYTSVPSCPAPWEPQTESNSTLNGGYEDKQPAGHPHNGSLLSNKNE